MINEQDIRIGNWYSANHDNMWGANDDGFFQWTMIHSGLECEGSIRLEDINEIPLTEQILMDAGFEKTERGMCYPEFTLTYTSGWHSGIFTISGFDGENEGYRWIEGNTNVSIWSVAHLQSLYYNITGQELNIQL